MDRPTTTAPEPTVTRTETPSWAIRGDGVLDEYASERHTVTATAEPAAFFWDGERFAIPHVQAAIWQNTTSLVPHLDLCIDNGQGCESQIRMTIAEARDLRDRLTLLVDAVECPEAPGSMLMPDAQRVAAIEGFPVRHDGVDDLPVIDRSVQPVVDAWRVDVGAFRGWLRDREAQRRDGLERQLAGTPGSAFYIDKGAR